MIPDWNMSGVLPPIRPDASGVDADRSPYVVYLHKIVPRFAISPERIAIIDGLLKYRKALHDVGLVSGFQWLDGSFMEHIERIELRSPQDVDVVTFFETPDGTTQEAIVQLDPDLFDHAKAKEVYSVDAYYCALGEPTSASHVKEISYWYSMWSHRRDSQWKGFIQVSLSPEEDIEAITALELSR